jgi:hypothetical protein
MYQISQEHIQAYIIHIKKHVKEAIQLEGGNRYHEDRFC